LIAGGDADSAGIPWAGRGFAHHRTEFADDDGSAPEDVLLAIRDVRAAARSVAARSSAGELAPLADATAKTIQAISQSRLLVPLLAEAGEYGETPEGRTVEKTQELSIVTVAS